MAKLITSALFMLIMLFSFHSMRAQEIEYEGVYAYGTSADSGRTGVISVYQNTDSTLLFYLELSRGAPSYNSGAMTGQMNILKPGEAEFSINDADDYINCSLRFSFKMNELSINTQMNADTCGYGYGVFSDGDFIKISTEQPVYFMDREGTEHQFETLDWKTWWY
jgi:hypothetical protein